MPGPKSALDDGADNRGTHLWRSRLQVPGDGRERAADHNQRHEMGALGRARPHVAYHGVRQPDRLFRRERERREREQLERRLRDKRAAGWNKTPKALLGDVASTVPAQAPVAAGDSSLPLHPPLSPVSAPGDEADEVTAVTPKTLDQSNDEKPAPAPATDAAAKTAAPSWRPRSPSPLSALSPSPPRKRRKTDGEEAQREVPAAETAPPASRKRRHSVTGSETDGGEDDGGAASGYTSASRKRARAAESGFTKAIGG